ncbi:MAG: IS4 family transposase [Rhodoferax sp.]|nr:IS4 family transposase [Rhodoferax sp.]
MLSGFWTSSAGHGPNRSQRRRTRARRKKAANGFTAWNLRSVLYEAAGELAVPRLIHLMDREGDAYEVMMTVEDSDDSAIIRSVQNRRTDDPLTKSHQAIRNQPVLVQASIEVKRKKDTPQRKALVEVRLMAVTLEPDLKKYPHAWPMRWNLVEVWEPTPPPGVEPLHWLLWTREIATTADDALEVVRKYTCRWPIEEMHLVLKSGCRVEDLRLETWDRLENAVRVNASVAARIVMLRDWSREYPQTLALQVLEKDEVDALVSHFGKGKAIAAADLTIRQAVLWIGRLGGHLNRKKGWNARCTDDVAWLAGLGSTRCRIPRRPACQPRNAGIVVGNAQP